MRIGEAAAHAGLEPTAIRFYESRGILPPARRSVSGYRDYDDADVELLRFVRQLRDLMLPLDDIRVIVQLQVRGEDPCETIKDVVGREVEAVRSRIAQLIRVRDRMVRMLTAPADSHVELLCPRAERADT